MYKNVRPSLVLLSDCLLGLKHQCLLDAMYGFGFLSVGKGGVIFSPRECPASLFAGHLPFGNQSSG